MTIRIISVIVKNEMDVVGARLRARQIANVCGFSRQDEIRIATSVSELARNAFNYANGGRVSFSIEGDTAPQILTIRVSDKGPGIPNIDNIFAGTYRSSTGMGKGIIGAKRLMDKCDIETGPAGTTIKLQKIFPRCADFLTPKAAADLFSCLAALPAEISTTEILEQNRELMAALANLKAKQEDLLQLTHELEDTNRGVVALYAELDEKADHLRRADEMKSRFLSNMSHEFRTPLSSIRALAKLLLDRVDGELSSEQEKQVSFILQNALNLTDLVNDLLDIAKIEAGRVDINAQRFDVAETFSALRGMLRPLLATESLSLVFVEPKSPMVLETDEAKLSQILRNFISNALKFTEAGQITISAEWLDDQQVRFSVSDTGIGIAKKDLDLIFEEFTQVQNPLQRRVKGTGLGLPLCRNLANLLNGNVSVESQAGKGSTFFVTIPAVFVPAMLEKQEQTETRAVEDNRIPVLIVEDNPQMHLLYEKFFTDTEFRVIAARTLREAAERWPQAQPAAVVLDIILHGEYTWSWLAELKNDPLTSHIPVIVATEVNDKRKGLSLGADAYFLKPMFKHQLLSSLRELLGISSQPAADATPSLA